MFDVTPELARQSQHTLDSLPVPMSPVCVRALVNTAAREHVYAEAHRRSGDAHRSQRCPRAVRLKREALRADARGADLMAEVS